MRLELLTDEQLDTIYTRLETIGEDRGQRFVDREIFDDIVDAALEELGIRTIETIRLDQGVERICECPFYGGYTLSNYESGCGAEMSPCWAMDESPDKRKWCPLRKGAILIKEEEE